MKPRIMIYWSSYAYSKAPIFAVFLPMDLAGLKYCINNGLTYFSEWEYKVKQLKS